MDSYARKTTTCSLGICETSVFCGLRTLMVGSFLPSLLFLSTTSSSRLMTPRFVTAGTLLGLSTVILFFTHVLSPHLSTNSILSNSKSVVARRLGTRKVFRSFSILNMLHHPLGLLFLANLRETSASRAGFEPHSWLLGHIAYFFSRMRGGGTSSFTVSLCAFSSSLFFPSWSLVFS